MKQLSQRSFGVSGRRRAPTVADLLTIAVLLSLVVFLATWMPRQGAATLALVQYAGGERQVRLDMEQSFELAGPLGPTTVRVSNGSIGIDAASCPRQLCRRMGRTKHPTRGVVCIPNQIRIRVLGETGEIDAIAR